MVGMSPAWKRHLYHKHRSAVRSSKTTSINDNSPTNNAEVLMSSNHVSSEIQINDPSTNVRLAVDQLKSFSIGTLAGLLGSLASSQRQGLVELDTAFALDATAMVTARLGAISSSFLSERVLKKCLGAFMICVAPLVPGKAYLEALHDNFDPSNPESLKHLKEDEAQHTQHVNLSQLERLLPASVIGMFSGFLSGMFGVGGGAIVVPALVLSTDMSHHSALGTSLCAMVLPAMVGTYTHSKRGNVNWRFGPLLALGSGVGAFLGGREVGIHLEEDVLRG